MTDSILTSVKKLLSGIPADNTDFDLDIIFAINNWFMVLNQVGAGPNEGFSITDANTTWNDYSNDPFLNKVVPEYIVAKVRLTFDPPQGGGMLDALNKLAEELEWRINVHCESGN